MLQFDTCQAVKWWADICYPISHKQNIFGSLPGPVEVGAPVITIGAADVPGGGMTNGLVLPLASPAMPTWEVKCIQLFIAFVLVEGFIGKYLRVTFTANGKLRNSQVENEHIKTAQTILMYKTGVNLLISVQLKWTVNDKLRETLVTWYIFTIAVCRKQVIYWSVSHDRVVQLIKVTCLSRVL